MPIAPAVGAALVSGGASLLGSLFGGHSASKAQKTANATNLQIARETNAQNYQIFKEQNAFNERMYNQMLDYNTPLNQMKRYDDAGINPYIAAGNVQTGNVQSALQSAPAPTMQAAQVMPVTGMANSMLDVGRNLGSMLGTYAQAKLAIAQANKTDAEARWVDRLNGAEVGLKGSQTNNNNFDFGFKLDTLGNMRDISDMSVTQMRYANTYMLASIYQQDLNSRLLELDVDFKEKYGEKQILADLSETASRIYANYLNANTNRMNARTNRMNADTNRFVGFAQARLMAEEALTEVEKRNGIHIENEIRDRAKQYIIDTYHSEAKSASNQAHTSFNVAKMSDSDAWWRGAHNATGVIGHLFGSGNDIYNSSQNVGKIKRNIKPRGRIGFK